MYIKKSLDAAVQRDCYRRRLPDSARTVRVRESDRKKVREKERRK